ncbi:hypothetical protein BS78_08G124600 [Paspalum vaginatum]|nr:hypothetical protein BS78_08G124600 [Paspalum vaginatum]
MVNLRVLSIVHCMNLHQLPKSFGKVCNLQTISLNHCRNLQQLPQCITCLCHLESMDLGYCDKLVELPEGIGNLENLKVLNLKKCRLLRSLPAGCGQLTCLQKLGLFVIGDSTKHAMISELGNLYKLDGELRIRNIKHVKEPGHVEKVRLKEKNGIQKLSLDWYSKWEVRSSGIKNKLLLDTEKDLHVLNCLEPPSALKKLRISGYRGQQLPCWMMKQNDSSDLSDINMLNLRSASQFSLLTNLVLKDLPNLEHLLGLVGLPELKILKLRGMPKLLELLTTTTGLANGVEEDEMQYCFPRLSTLVISDCPNLSVKPYYPVSLQSLTLEGSSGHLLSSGCFFHPHHAGHAHGDECSSSCIVDVKRPHLTELKLGRLIGSSSDWDVLQHLTGLLVLEISKCRDLSHLPESMKCLTCLRRLVIEYCDNLRVLPVWLGELQSLQVLHIHGLPIMSIPPESLQHLTSHEILIIMDCNALHQLPEQLGELSSLRTLVISELPALTHLPESMQRLTSLRTLSLYSCLALSQLPESLGELSALRKFFIQSCPGLTALPHSIQRLALEKLMIYKPQ